MSKKKIGHFLLKFNHGVEIGAYLAYMGHYEVTGDKKILSIAKEELVHKRNVKRLLAQFGEKPSPTIDRTFKIIGSTIRKLCFYSPTRLLNFVACSMEYFAVFSYSVLAKIYPDQKLMFELMAMAEEEHKQYFKIVY